jgi:uncharacterized protein (DUF1684 family)
VVIAAGPAIAADFQSEIAAWRADREARLKAPDGWLSLVGLSWLKEGGNIAGSAPDARVQLPAKAPAQAGVFTLRGDTIEFTAAPGVQAIFNGKPARSALLRPDSEDMLDVAGVKLLAIKRGRGYGIRVKDSDSPFRRSFTTLRWYPPKRDWVIQAKFVPYPQPRKIQFEATAGGKQDVISRGYVEFMRAGRNLRLAPVDEEGRLFFIFRDRAAGKTTYPAARFLYADAAKNGIVTLDFNKAYNPPCVFTPYSTCPLPPPENRLPIPVEAGEMMYETRK